MSVPLRRGQAVWWVLCWPVSVAVNLGFGYVITFPMLFLYWGVRALFNDWWVSSDFSEQEMLLFGGVGTVVVLAPFIALNWFIVRTAGAPARWYWPLAVAVLLAPLGFMFATA